MSVRNTCIAVSTAVLVLAGWGQAADATPITYNGATFDLTLESQTDVAAGTKYRFDYSADFSGWSGPSRQAYIAAVNFKPNTGSVPLSVTLVSTTAPNALSDWTKYGNGNCNNSGCSGGAGSFAYAIADPLNLAPTTTGATYDWVFDLTYGSALSDSAFSGMPIRAWFVDDNIYDTGKGTGLMSMTTGVPEPSTLALLGFGLAALGWFTGRRRRIGLPASS